MISFIIPTIYKAPQLPQLISNLENCDLVDEILIIEDNHYNGILDGYAFNKVNIIPFKNKKYCNGGWNLGINLIKNNYYALCNDDILFPTIIIEDILYFYKQRPKSGFIGMDFSQYEINRTPNVYGFEKIENLGLGWGCLIFNHKNNDVIIPDDLKHWCGDNYYINYSKYPCYKYFGEKFQTSKENWSTSFTEELKEIIKNDSCIYESKYKLEKPIWT